MWTALSIVLVSRQSCLPASVVVALGASNLTLGFPAVVSSARAAGRRWLFGVDQFTPQEGVRLRSGGRVWIY